MSATQLNPGPADAPATSVGEFETLLSREFRPKSESARDSIAVAVKTLAEQALAQTAVVSDDALTSISEMIKAIDETLTRQVNLIIHDENFQQLENAWRGLHYLVNNTETDEMLKIRVMNISKKELGRTLRKFRGTAWDQSTIFRKVYEEEFGQLGGEPYGVLIGNYEFDHRPDDVAMLSDLAMIAAAAHAPFISAASPSLMQMDSWSEVGNPRDIGRIFGT